MKLKDLKKAINSIGDAYPESDSWDVMVNIGTDFEMLRIEAIYEGSLWNVVIDCDYQPEEVLVDEMIYNNPNPLTDEH
ncbi:hypothetical protein [Chryseobacterium koreense]|uniref:Uncharacterized protein n=1 Tax=Chryseobacterium koreense CCUG 49689 TaxID=1304281 RepID=A0A0J7IWZ1_9FLAO|nr:hypothetical protein [Chryseobacterium koreense]KMQ70329.1 hypothetical protein ACM44_12995 [Chryseobacterium koreense CCUG 49689]MBB5334498.1 hypothetical protein [Chryseobacterium koreense]